MWQVREASHLILAFFFKLKYLNRQGVLPFPRFWASTRPFGTALGPYIAKWVITVIMILAPPAGDAFNFSQSPRQTIHLGKR